MLQKYHIIKNTIILILITFIGFSCAKDSKKKEDILPEKDWLPSTDQRVKQAYKEGGGLLGNKGVVGGNSKGGSIRFADTNLMWKAAIRTLENIPLMNVDYAGGIIITDWYGTSNNADANQEIKITVKFISDEVKSSSFEIITHKKSCTKNNCTTTLGDSGLNEKIKEKIVASARSISLEEEKKKK